METVHGKGGEFPPLLIFSLIGVVAIGAALLLFFVDPAAGNGLYPPCPFHYLTGLHCPGCGSLRATHQLLHGNIRGAFALNPLYILMVPFLGYALLSRLVERLRGTPLPIRFLSRGEIMALAIVFILYGILRNLPLWPFTLLSA
jgi:hypothetical protein